jgi:hypothetical protein
MVEFTLKGDLIGDFLHEFGEANRMWVRFDAGTEQPWVADMVGSRKAAAMFKNCVASLPQPTQPFAQQPSQPYSSASKKDDGGI